MANFFVFLPFSREKLAATAKKDEESKRGERGRKGEALKLRGGGGKMEGRKVLKYFLELPLVGRFLGGDRKEAEEGGRGVRGGFPRLPSLPSPDR